MMDMANKWNIYIYSAYPGYGEMMESLFQVLFCSAEDDLRLTKTPRKLLLKFT